MAHCPQCGSGAPEGASACPTCGEKLAPVPSRAQAGPGAKTIVGVSAKDVLPAALLGGAPPTDARGKAEAPGAKTMVGLPARALGPMPPLEPQRPAEPHEKAAAKTIIGHAPISAPPSGAASSQNRTLLGVARPEALAAASAGARANDRQAPSAGGATLLGVARPGIAPLAPGVAEPAYEEEIEEDDGAGASPELGATIGALSGPVALAPGAPPGLVRRARRPKAAAPPPPEKTSARAIAIIGTAGALALVAVLVALLLPSAPPIVARARADAEGKDAIEITCASCANGTKVSIGDASADVADHVALVPAASPLAVGDNKVKVTVERPNGGRKETVSVNVPVAYRIRPDLSTLQGEKPAIQVVAESATGTSVVLDGKPLAPGHAVETFDVTSDVTGTSDETKTLARKIPYTVTTADGKSESGQVTVSVAIVPLHIEAPGPRITIDSATFVLAGRTVKGAEVLAAGRPITVKLDGSFAQVMNVSAVGATQIDVRAKLAGMAPRIVPIAVRRVDALDAAAKEFAAQPGVVSYGVVARDIAANVGKAIVLGGEDVEARRQGYETILLVDVAPSFGCASGKDSCHVRLVQGAENDARPGDSIRAYGYVARAFAIAGRAPIPEVNVELSLKGLK